LIAAAGLIATAAGRQAVGLQPAGTGHREWVAPEGTTHPIRPDISAA
jgi:hypothetical protein